MPRAEIINRSSAGAAALAKNASSEADQISVASVLKPVGASNNVAGSSLIVVRKTRPAQRLWKVEGSAA